MKVRFFELAVLLQLFGDVAYMTVEKLRNWTVPE